MSEQENLPPIGYEPHGGGGITNQKIAFVGLLVEAHATNRPVVLPRFKIFDQITKQFRPLAFEDVFEFAPMSDFCERNSIRIAHIDPKDLPGGYDDYFWKMHSIFHNIPQNKNNSNAVFVLDAFEALVPRVRNAFLMKILREKVVQDNPDFAVVQFRIEKDWQDHCEQTLDAIVPSNETNYLKFDDILEKIIHSELNTKKIFALCDERALPISKEEMKSVALDRFGISIHLKSDYLSNLEMELLTPLHLSLIDFEIATGAARFVGLTRSTFSCLATLEKYARDRRDVRQHYIYNLSGSKVVERTDNGCYWDAHAAALGQGAG
ncbi:O-fucosyltransferase family protein [Methylobacterium sp. J-078]|uniref:O-fucosyltransferase family protein n=1 Tax=Methylobacterium sp. J-078 TaxID=2836657 RepID=UPI001FB97B68|nr:O-fucosyltransferase family protein [Methylobacterium sp. J-078]MCJ2043152.1 O-fucosyltransferase family protein [Methylobacterium sp. J-078]